MAVEDVAEAPGCVRQQHQRPTGLMDALQNLDDAVSMDVHMSVSASRISRSRRAPGWWPRTVAQYARSPSWLASVCGTGVPEGVLEGGEVVLGPQGGAGQAEPLVGGGLQADDAIVRRRSSLPQHAIPRTRYVTRT